MSVPGASSISPLDVDLNKTYGALFIGATLAAVLFGLTNVQAFVYFQNHRGSGITFFKLVIYYLWVLDAIHLSFVTHMIHYYLINNYANPLALPVIVWSFQAQVVVDVLIVYAIHLWTVHPAPLDMEDRGSFRLSWHTVVVVLASGTSSHGFLPLLSADCVPTPVTQPSPLRSFGLCGYQCHVFTDLISIEWSLYLTLGSMSVVDMLIAASMCYLLSTARTGFSRTDSFLTKLMAYILNTGLLTSLCSLTVVITCAAMPRNFVFLGVDFVCVKLYVNAFVALLNARYYLQNDSTSDSSHTQNPDLRMPTSLPERNMISKYGASVAEHPARPLLSDDGQALLACDDANLVHIEQTDCAAGEPISAISSGRSR
ncbi:hypothetical protein BV22DRAFT_1126548 [Leucogyrophana mollusca]|uniref:Uncharacterized protein n=1 Tax=Leucogyrophana mollusca TaxID=85980 RepID=A0ACB8BS93_9AGAM|nr:hypothetical protein BV22DRAFT_1126548 [Leucogyrophana mollusca]